MIFIIQYKIDVYFCIQITITVSRAVKQALLMAEGLFSAQSAVLI
jgi:hypothetical protein